MAHYFLINHKLKLIAVCSPKCASQSISRWFLDSLNREPDQADDSLGSYLVRSEEIPGFRDYWKVMFIRDPLRRLVSFYSHWVVRSNRHWCFADRDQRFSLHGKSFRQFIYVLDHLSLHHIMLQHHLLPQADNVTHIRFDHVLLVENISRDLPALNRELGISVDIPGLNRGRYATILREPAADRSPEWLGAHGIPEPGWFYDDEIRAIAERVYAQDAEFYRSSSGNLLTQLIS